MWIRDLDRRRKTTSWENLGVKIMPWNKTDPLSRLRPRLQIHIKSSQVVAITPRVRLMQSRPPSPKVLNKYVTWPKRKDQWSLPVSKTRRESYSTAGLLAHRRKKSPKSSIACWIALLIPRTATTRNESCVKRKITQSTGTCLPRIMPRVQWICRGLSDASSKQRQMTPRIDKKKSWG